MALKITDNFNYTGRKPNFQRDQFATTSEMNAYTVCDEGHISYNLQDNKHYSFKNGAWSVLQTGGGSSSYTHPSSHPASIITYDSSETYESGNVGYEIKQLVTSLAAKYVKPGTGVPKTDLANDVQTSLDYADDYNTNKSSFVTSTALEAALTGLSPYSAGTGISITTVSNGKQIAIDSAVYKVKDVQNASGTSLITSGIATIPITQINKSDNTQLSPVSGVITLPEIPDDATGISFDDSMTQLSTQEDPVTDVQTAINAIVTTIASSISVLVIKLIDHNGNNIVGQSVVINETYNGTTNTYTVNTDSNGTAACSIHYGSVYTIIYQNRTNRFTPTSVTGIAESIHINIFAKYNLNADYENIHCYVKIKGVNINNYNVNDKKLYIDYKYTDDNTVNYIRKYTIVLNSSGTAKTIYDENNNIVANCTIPKNQYYRVSLEDYTDMDKTADLEYKSEYFDRTITMYYYYKLSGVFLLVEDYIDNVDANDYSEYKCINFDDVENKITVVDSNNDSWDIVKDVTTGDLMKSPVGQENYSIWIESSNFDRILGIGLRTSNSIDALINNSEAESQGFTDSSMLLTNKALVSGYYSSLSSSFPGIDNSYSGKYLTQVLVDSTDPYSQIANKMTAVTLKTGNVTQKAFILTWNQAKDLYQNKTLICQIASIINFTILTNTFNWNSIPVCSYITRVTYWRVLQNGVDELYNAPQKTASQACLPIFSF